MKWNIKITKNLYCGFKRWKEVEKQKTYSFKVWTVFPWLNQPNILYISAIVDLNTRPLIYEDDLFGLELDVVDENKTKKELKIFGIIRSHRRLKLNDKIISDEIKIKLKDSKSLYENDISKQDNVHVYQVKILVRKCKYTIKSGEKLIIQVCQSFIFFSF